MTDNPLCSDSALVLSILARSIMHSGNSNNGHPGNGIRAFDSEDLAWYIPVKAAMS